MRTGFSSHRRGHWLAALAAGAVAWAAEKEERIVPVTQTREDTAISATKREFDSSKSSRDPAVQVKGDVPRFTVPEMAPSPSGWTPAKPKAGEKKPNNWLLDAMEKPTDHKSTGRDPAERETERDPAGREVDRLKLDRPANGEPESPNDTRRDGDRKLPTTTVDNPLTRFLGAWMTPQDYALLQPGLAESARSGGSRERGIAGALSVPGLTPPGVEVSTALMASSPPVVVQKPRDNPFLQSLNVSGVTSPAPAFVPPPQVSAPPPVATPMAPPPIVVPSKSNVPDFAKPAQDEKYFKQLKRF